MSGGAFGLVAALVPLGVSGDGASALQRSDSAQIAEAVAPLSRGYRDEATVMGYDASGELTVIRVGTNQYRCVADDPSDRRFQVSCYHQDLEAFMARGRELRALGKRGRERQEIRNAEIESGLIQMPERASLISYYGVGDRDPVTGHPDSVTVLRVLYLPYATSEETGIPDRPSRSSPYLMNAGTARAHLMIPGERRAYRSRREPRRRR